MTRPWIPLLLGLGLLASCDDDSATIEPTPEGLKTWDLVGQVVDARGEPVSGAYLNFTYTVIIHGDTLVTPIEVDQKPAFTLGPVDSFFLEVFDHRERLIWEQQGEAGEEAFWDGSTSSGNPVVDGPYLLRITTYSGTEIETISQWAVVIRDTEVRARIAEATTDSGGRFHAPIRDLPIWKSYPGSAGVIQFGSLLGVFAYRGDGSLQHDLGLVDLSVFPTQPLVLQIPDP